MDRQTHLQYLADNWWMATHKYSNFPFTYQLFDSTQTVNKTLSGGARIKKSRFPQALPPLRFLNGAVLRNLNIYSFQKLYPVSSANMKYAGLWEGSQQAGNLIN